MLAVLIVVSLGLSIYASVRYVGLVNCLNARDVADAKRTRAIAIATDHERVADRELLMGHGDPAVLRQQALEARDATDRVRAANPPPDRASCS